MRNDEGTLAKRTRQAILLPACSCASCTLVRIASRDAIRIDELQKCSYAALTVIFLAIFCASAFFGKVTASTPFLKLASILSGSTLSGT
jgi:hypothetical protein